MKPPTLLSIFAFICVVGAITAADNVEAVSFGLLGVALQGLAAFIVWSDKWGKP